MTTQPPRASVRLQVLVAATALCYLIGYPLALIGHSAVGWIFVALGGPFLIALLVVVIRRIHAGSLLAGERTEVGPDLPC